MPPTQSSHSPARIDVQVNGDARTVAAGTTVAELLGELGLAGRKVAVAVNRGVVPRTAHAGRRLEPGDRIEILEAVGGG